AWWHVARRASRVGGVVESRFECFFFWRYGAHRVLSSFPTRRSSDLILVAEAEAIERRDLAVVDLRAGAADRRVVVGPSPGREPLDRKSTRLNSSHVAISYAVFCLKKKTSSKSSTRGLYAPVRNGLLS